MKGNTVSDINPFIFFMINTVGILILITSIIFFIKGMTTDTVSVVCITQKDIEHIHAVEQIIENNQKYNKKDFGIVEQYNIENINNINNNVRPDFERFNEKSKYNQIAEVVYLNNKNILILNNPIPMKIGEKLSYFEADIEKDSSSIYLKNRTFVCNEDNQCSLRVITQ